MDAAEVQCRIGHSERIVVETLFQIVAQLQNMADGIMHQFNGVHPACGIA